MTAGSRRAIGRGPRGRRRMAADAQGRAPGRTPSARPGPGRDDAPAEDLGGGVVRCDCYGVGR